MGRIQPKTQQAPRETPAQRRKREAIEAAARAAATESPARRGEPDGEEETPRLPQQAAEPTNQVLEADPDAVTTAAEQRTGLQYVPPPVEADDLTKLAHAQRGIVRANRAVALGMGSLERDYVLSAGAYLWAATELKWYKAAKHKGVEPFAESLGMTKQEVYRLRRALPVYEVIYDLVEEPLNERTIRELFRTLTNEKGELQAETDRHGNVLVDRDHGERLRAQFQEMKRLGRVTSAGAAAARRLLALGEATELIQTESRTLSGESLRDKVDKARKQNRLLGADVLKELATEDRGAAEAYVKEMRERLEAAEKVIAEA